MNVGDLAVVTGPLRICALSEVGNVGIFPGSVVEVIDVDTWADPDSGVSVLVHPVQDENPDYCQWIDPDSLTSLTVIQDDPTVQWGDLLDPNFVHDFVWDGDEE